MCVCVSIKMTGTKFIKLRVGGVRVMWFFLQQVGGKLAEMCWLFKMFLLHDVITTAAIF